MTSSALVRQSSTIPSIRLRSPADLVAFTPYLLGFHPTRSVVVTAFRGDRVVFAARSDLPDPQTPSAAAMARELVTVVARQRPDTLAVLGYGAAAEVDEMVRAVQAAAGQHEFPLREVLRIDAGRWWSYLCHEPRCCSPEGTPFDPAASEVSAQCTLAGLVAVADREQVAAQVAPVTGAERVAMERAVDRAEQTLTQLLARLPWEQWSAAVHSRGQSAVRAAVDRYAEGGRLDDDQLAELSILLVSVPVRDYAWQAITTVEPHLRLWSDATRRVLPDLASAPASLLGFTAWRAGDGALARLALERALAADPSYSMARLLLEGLQNGVPPSVLDDWLTPASDDTPGKPTSDDTPDAPGAGNAASGAAGGSAGSGASAAPGESVTGAQAHRRGPRRARGRRHRNGKSDRD